MATSLSLDVRDNTENHVNDCLVRIGLPAETFRSVLIGQLTHYCRTFCNLEIAVEHIWEIWEIQVHSWLD